MCIDYAHAQSDSFESLDTFLLPSQETIFSMVHSRHLVDKTKIVIRFIGSEIEVLEGKSVQNNSNELSL